MSNCSKFLFVCVYLHIRTVVKCNIAKSQALYSAQRGLKTNNAAVLKVGAIFINIPQHPATLHSMMVRSSHQLSKQISDLIRQPSNMWGKPLHFLFITIMILFRRYWIQICLYQPASQPRRDAYSSALWSECQSNSSGGQWVSSATRGTGEEADRVEIQRHAGWDHYWCSPVALS